MENVKKFDVRKYTVADRVAWNALVAQAKNATFLFDRGFMDYHQDRFDDFSLTVWQDGKLVGAMPANRVGDTVHSHQGLTYGGLFTRTIKLIDFLAMLEAVLYFLADEGVARWQVKQFPSFYATAFSDELTYALFLLGAECTRTDALAVVPIDQVHLSKSRNEGVKRGRQSRLEVRETDDFAPFWNQVLSPNLSAKHQATPVHSLQEITLLKSRFPQNIRQFDVYESGSITAGTTLFVNRDVVHAQYISAAPGKNRNGALDFLYEKLLCDVFRDMRLFDFGISNENHGRNVNHGLQFWKEGFGTQTVTQGFYTVDTSMAHRLQNIVI